MRPLPRSHRRATILWLIVAVVVWNGIYDMMLKRGIKEYLFRAALFDAGRGAAPSIAGIMDKTVFDATWIATVWACSILIAGLFTIRIVGRGCEC